jgi:small-conductance mechanosensitive channel
MTESKNPFQIRQELLNTAKEYVESMYSMQQNFVDRQFYLAEEMLNKNQEEGMKLYQQSIDNMEKYCKNYPGVDQILAVAKQFQDFVDNKDKK